MAISYMDVSVQSKTVYDSTTYLPRVFASGVRQLQPAPSRSLPKRQHQQTLLAHNMSAGEVQQARRRHLCKELGYKVKESHQRAAPLWPVLQFL
eukprot:jgi/Chlat1/7530/Chrsp62S07046